MIQMRLKYRTTPTNLRTFLNSYDILVKIFCHSVLLISAHLTDIHRVEKDKQLHSAGNINVAKFLTFHLDINTSMIPAIS